MHESLRDFTFQGYPTVFEVFAGKGQLCFGFARLDVDATEALGAALAHEAQKGLRTLFAAKVHAPPAELLQAM